MLVDRPQLCNSILNTTHIIDGRLCRHEATTAYTDLLSGIAAPLLVTTDVGQGAQSAIKTVWPITKVQHCLVHLPRVARRHTTSRPRTPASTTLYRLALKLTRIPVLGAAGTIGIGLFLLLGAVRAVLLGRLKPTQGTMTTPEISETT
ncbi:hypothetical protein BJF89_17535 [Corynebacterium sp. CNJ-954]|nr:hypothetical protein BJF89_17535 [Corynebacterium sp. CNJ-954]